MKSNPKGSGFTLMSVVIAVVAGVLWPALGMAQTKVGQPTISQPPANQTASLFADATFRAVAQADSPLRYQWQFNHADIPGSTNTTLTITNVQRSDAGSYGLVVDTPNGSVSSQVATLTITPFNSIYEFGWSFTDTQGFNPSGSPCTWYHNPLYYQNHACNGPMWPELLSTNLGLAYAAANNYARCGAALLDVQTQVTTFKAPAKPQLSLYCLQAAGPDASLANLAKALTNEVAGSELLHYTLMQNSNSVSRLYTKGARSILILLDNVFPVPEFLTFFGTNSVLNFQLTDYYARFNASFIEAMNAFSKARPDVRILYVDPWSHIEEVLANLDGYGFTVATIDAIHDPALTDKSFAGPGADYVFWVGGHPTSKLHKLAAGWNLEVLANSILEELAVTIAGASPNLTMNHLQIGREYTLETSRDLRHWQIVQSFTAAAGTNQWSAPPNSATAAFCRLNWRP